MSALCSGLKRLSWRAIQVLPALENLRASVALVHIGFAGVGPISV